MHNKPLKNIRKSFNRSLIKIILASATLSSGYSAAQGMTEEEILDWRRAVEASTKVLSSGKDMHELPPYVVYHTIFRHVLVNPSLATRFPDSDFDIIKSLPSHNDATFISLVSEIFDEACSKIKTIRGSDSDSARAMAEHFENAKTQIRDSLNDHYEAVVLELSGEGRQIVQDAVIQLSYSNAISSADLDLAILSEESPQSAAMFINQSCANHAQASAQNEARSITLLEEIEESVRNGSARFSPSIPR